jgi:hypothetical protein
MQEAAETRDAFIRPGCGRMLPKLQLSILFKSSLVAPALSQPPPVNEITTNTPSALSAISVNLDHSPFDAHTMVNILAQNKRLEDIVTGFHCRLKCHHQSSNLLVPQTVNIFPTRGKNRSMMSRRKKSKSIKKNKNSRRKKGKVSNKKLQHIKVGHGNKSISPFEIQE